MAKTLVAPQGSVTIDLGAAIVAVSGGVPQILLAQSARGDAVLDGQAISGLPSGPFDPALHRTFEIGLRSWVSDQTGLELGYAEQLYTFGDRGRLKQPMASGPHAISVGYLALTRVSQQASSGSITSAFQPWYRFFPWEDWRKGRPAIIEATILPALRQWSADRAGQNLDTERRLMPRQQRLTLCFGEGVTPWDEERALERYELLYDAGLIAEAWRDRGETPSSTAMPVLVGEAMRDDHRRILATAIGRLRAKLKYRPVIFELMADSFTLTALQTTAEAISGRPLHKQNFRRLVESGALVESTGETTRTSGRPAALFRFRREVMAERPSPGLRLGARQ
jgi:hypothetical protein